MICVETFHALWCILYIIFWKRIFLLWFWYSKMLMKHFDLTLITTLPGFISSFLGFLPSFLPFFLPWLPFFFGFLPSFLSWLPSFLDFLPSLAAFSPWLSSLLLLCLPSLSSLFVFLLSLSSFYVFLLCLPSLSSFFVFRLLSLFIFLLCLPSSIPSYSYVEGHGGLMDRMDCQLLMMAFTSFHYRYYHLLPCHCLILLYLWDSLNNWILSFILFFRS